MGVTGAGERIQSELSCWQGITSAPDRFGGVAFKLGTLCAIGHIHGDFLVDVPLPKRVRDELVASAQAEPHHVLPQSGWVSVHLNNLGDVNRALLVLQRSFEIAQEQKKQHAGR